MKRRQHGRQEREVEFADLEIKVITNPKIVQEYSRDLKRHLCLKSETSKSKPQLSCFLVLFLEKAGVSFSRRERIKTSNMAWES